MHTEAASILGTQRKRDVKARLKFDAQHAALMLEQLKLKLNQETLSRQDDVSVMFDSLLNLRKSLKPSTVKKKTLKFSKQRARFVTETQHHSASSIRQYMPIGELFGVLVKVMEFGLTHKLDWVTRFGEKQYRSVAAIDNHLKEVTTEQRVKYRRLVAMCLYQAGKYIACFRYATQFLVYHGQAQWTWQLMSLLYPHLPVEDKRKINYQKLLIKNVRYRLQHYDADSMAEKMLLANASLHKDNISAIKPFWALKQESEVSLLDLCLFVACIRAAHSRTSNERPKQLRQAMAFLAIYKRKRTSEGHQAEVQYNVARSMQLMGLNIGAEQVYRQML